MPNLKLHKIWIFYTFLLNPVNIKRGYGSSYSNLLEKFLSTGFEDTWKQHFVFGHWCLHLHWKEKFPIMTHRWWRPRTTCLRTGCNLCSLRLRVLKKFQEIHNFAYSYNLFKHYITFEKIFLKCNEMQINECKYFILQKIKISSF